MITLNGKEYAANKAELTPAANGFYRVNHSKRYPGRVSVTIFNREREPIALVSPDAALVTAAKLESGGIFYMYAMTAATHRALGIPEDMLYSQKRSIAENVLSQVNARPVFES